MFNYNLKNNPNIGFFRYSNNNNHNFINRNKLDQNNPYIGYFSQFNNKNKSMGKLVTPIQLAYYPYFKLNPFIISKLVSNIGTNVILFDNNFNQIDYSKYFFHNFFNNKRQLNYSETDSIKTERETIDSVDANTQTDYDILLNNEKGIQTDEINDSEEHSDICSTNSNDSIFLKNSIDTNILCDISINGEQQIFSETDNINDEEDNLENEEDNLEDEEDNLEDEYVLIN